MIEKNQELTSLAASVIGQKLMLELNQDPAMNHQGWKILARWAVNQPEDLKELLTKQGEPGIYSRLMNQLELETEVLQNNQDSSLSMIEKLQLAEVKMDL